MLWPERLVGLDKPTCFAERCAAISEAQELRAALRALETVKTVADLRAVVGYMVHSGEVENAALYPLSRHAEALDAADRWKASITSLVCAPGGPDVTR